MTILPSSLWMAYTITSPKEISEMLPLGLHLSRYPLLNNDVLSESKLLFNAYDVSSKWMNGHRIDIQTLAVNRTSNTAHLVILDCITDTLQWDPNDGVGLPNACRSRPKDKENNFSLNVRSKRGKKLVVKANPAGLSKMTWKFAIEGNEKCYYRNCENGFKMSFDFKNILKPVRNLNVNVLENTFWENVREQSPSHIFIHEQPMTFDVDVRF